MIASRQPLIQDLRTTLFAPNPSVCAGVPAIGVELELLPVSDDTGRRVPTWGPRRSLMAVLRPLAQRLSWREELSAKGSPVFFLPGGSSITFEPGGQLELSIRPHGSVSQLMHELNLVQGLCDRACADQGITLHATGIDGENPIEDVPLQFDCDRYRRMAAYFDHIGPAGVRMMRQTAALHVNLDLGDRLTDRWRMLNAAAPVLVAMFANSNRYEGTATGCRSYRAETWRTLDWSRTGLADRGQSTDAVTDYLNFALDARSMLHDPIEGEYLPFGTLWDEGRVDIQDWQLHLTTLFPEIRPRGYFEVRALDAMSPSDAAAPIAMMTGLCYDDRSLGQAVDLLGTPRTALLHVAGQRGLDDTRLASLACQLVDIGLAGCRRLGSDVVEPGDLERAEDFFNRYTRRRRCPADDDRQADSRVAVGVGG